ncbi:hypothetical protein [Mycolicibacterium arenosum]|uniref:Uncharacterized protein n=1 Tax=Mycolicibacterium arenosum TaxID=2952157 RepID=A0ABT1M663_9MYCO|nr:hypothetical protein [Mycolicibacterium sp. CAU 1645]MCP9274674.1 hypothetical protein [Mycolicibacterium sp. CAU 1645]
MPTPVTRCALAVAAVMTVLAFGGVGAGVALADPDEQSNTTEPTGSTEPSNVVEPPTTPTPTVPTTVRSLPEQLRDFLHKPLSVFGNGRVPGEVPTTSTTPDSAAGAKNAEDQTDTIEGVLPRKDEKPEAPAPPKPEVPAPVVIKKPVGSTAEVRLPFVAPFSVPVPSVPGTRDMQWSINLTDPVSTYATIEQTFATFNSLIADAYAPYDPWPKPAPAPALRTFQEGPVLEVDGSPGGGGGVTPVSAGPGGDLPIVAAPPVVVPRAVPPSVSNRPVRGVSPVPEVLAGGSAGAHTPGLRGSVASTGTVAVEPVPAAPAGTSPMGTPAVRQGYAQSLRIARMGEIAVVAVPGAAGLLALTFSGGVIGYRQANSGRYLRQEAVRFVR